MIEKLLSEDASILKEEQMNVFVNDLADSAVVLGIRAWVKNEEYWATDGDCWKKLKWNWMRMELRFHIHK